jgi:hypothetical protein
MTLLERAVRLFNIGAMGKYEFYHATRHYSAKQVAEASGIDIDVVRDRRRYLRQLGAPQR